MNEYKKFIGVEFFAIGFNCFCSSSRKSFVAGESIGKLTSFSSSQLFFDSGLCLHVGNAYRIAYKVFRVYKRFPFLKK